MSDLKKYIAKRQQKDKDFRLNFNEGYQAFKIGILLKEIRQAAGITQDELATCLHTKISGIFNIRKMDN